MKTIANYPIVYKVVDRNNPMHIVGEVIRTGQNEAHMKIYPDVKDGPFAFISCRERGQYTIDEKATEMILRERVIDPHYQGIGWYLREKGLEYWDLWTLIEMDKGICSRDRFMIVKEERKVSKQFENSYLYNKYMELQSHQRVVLSHVAALEALGIFSGYSNEYTVEYYALSSAEVNNTQFHPVGRLGFNAIGSVYTKGVYCTDINRTINDVLVDSDRIDDTPILEALNTYYYENGESFDNLLLTEEARQSLEKYKEDAIYYYDKAEDD